MSQRERAYVPRGIFRRYDLEKHAQRIRALEAARCLPHNSVWRSWTLHDLSRCQHTAMVQLSVENAHGAWEVEVCVNCGEQVSKHCAHVHSTWNDEGTVLTCDNCGIDGT